MEVVVGNHPFPPPLSAPGRSTPTRSIARRGRPAGCRDVVRVRAGVHVGPDGGETADEGVTAQTHGPAPPPMAPCPPGAVGDVVGRGDALKVPEPAARVERAVAVGRQRMDGAGEGGDGDDRGARVAAGQVAGEQVVRGRDARAVLEQAADVERLADDLQARHVAAECRPVASQNGAQLTPSHTARKSASASPPAFLKVPPA